jgi:hypothetical protein
MRPRQDPILRRAAALCAVALLASAAAAAPVKVRHPEGPAHGFVVLTDAADKTIAHGEMTQWLEDGTVVSRLLFRFADGSLYDEVVRFTQRSVFRLQSYKLVQRGPSFTETAEIEFDHSGTYRVRQRPAPDKEEETASGEFEVPEDASNGLTSILLKNLLAEGAGRTHLIAFTPDPVVLDLHLTPAGTADYAAGPITGTATHYVMKPEVPGFKGVLADLLGKQPPTYSMWIAQGAAPVLIHFEGPMYASGPTWRINVTGPRLTGGAKRQARATDR